MIGALKCASLTDDSARPVLKVGGGAGNFTGGQQVKTHESEYMELRVTNIRQDAEIRRLNEKLQWITTGSMGFDISPAAPAETAMSLSLDAIDLTIDPPAEEDGEGQE